ncbi:hypothetical protein [Cyanobium sp. ATX 6F1]|uniref:hypothetical protein n=1 Tax=Cyanobium sp. ATX 6F1 TaxID=2823702 RepID=UPI0020CC21A0|nr:hypothetical protein [Cyanobium sp. ATX 6F1]MCP9916290.1 hypothetical protein [Cyanobium sp. ATX 6F1]
MAGSSNRARRRGGEPIDSRLGQGFDRFLDAGRQLVNGVAGARPGSRPSGSAGPGRGGGRAGLGAWVEDRLDWLLEDEDDWREPWQEASRTAPNREAPYGDRWGRESASRPTAGRPTADRYAPSPPVQPRPVATWGGEPPEPSPRRQPLEAISRRSTPLLPPVSAPPGADDWPDLEEFSVPRWRRPARPAVPEAERPELRAGEPEGTAGRPLPRSTRRRS